MTDPDIIIADIIQTELALPPGRIVVGLENFSAPKDSDLYIIVMTAEARVIAGSVYFDPDTDKEIKEVLCSSVFNIEIVSRGRGAMTRKEEVVSSLKSSYALDVMEKEQCRITRTGQILDLSAVEGASALKRYRIPVNMMYKKTYEKGVNIFEAFPVEEETE
jgi:hypothetical protein